MNNEDQLLITGSDCTHDMRNHIRSKESSTAQRLDSIYVTCYFSFAKDTESVQQTLARGGTTGA